MKENIQIVFGLLGGLAVFIYGMNMMSECLQKAAGEKMKKILSLLTRESCNGSTCGNACYQPYCKVRVQRRLWRSVL